jgi:LPXTG-site transpeptidase (sortase) family protein
MSDSIVIGLLVDFLDFILELYHTVDTANGILTVDMARKKQKSASVILGKKGKLITRDIKTRPARNPRSIWESFKKRNTKSKVIIISSVVVAILSFILLILPYLPRIDFLVRKPKIDPNPYSKAAEEGRRGTTKISDEAIQKLKGNRLILPSIGVNAEIIDGRDVYVIGKNQGVWRETNSIDPSKDGNIVIAGHRFLYTARNGGYFYNLPELKLGSKIYIRWKDTVYEYEVYNTKTVLPEQVDIRDRDPKVSKKLTLYTCYPLGSTAKRYVVEAKQL